MSTSTTSNTGKYSNAYNESGLERVKRETQEISDLVASRGSFADILGEMYDIDDAVNTCSAGHSSSKKSCCPIHGSKNNGKNFRFLKNGAEFGTCVCHSCGMWKTGFDLIMEADKCSFREAVKMVGYFVGYYSDRDGHVDSAMANEVAERQAKYLEEKKKRQIVQAKRDKINHDKGVKRLCEMWTGAVSLDHPFAEPARKYFVKRGLGNIGTLNGEVVLHPALEFFVTWVNPKNPKETKFVLAGKYPCLLAQIRTPEGKPTRIHRTYLDWNGNKLDLASVPNNLAVRGISINDVEQTDPKKMTPHIPLTDISGASIQLSDAGTKVIGVGEGLETTLAVSIATGMPVNCCINATMLASWLPAKGTEYVFIFKDKDVSKTGAICGDELRARLEPFGIKVFDFEPSTDIPKDETGVDWADVFNLEGILGFPMEARNWRSLL